MISERPIKETRKLIAGVDQSLQQCRQWKYYVELVEQKYKLLELLNKMIHQQEIAYQKKPKTNKEG